MFAWREEPKTQGGSKVARLSRRNRGDVFVGGGFGVAKVEMLGRWADTSIYIAGSMR